MSKQEFKVFKDKYLYSNIKTTLLDFQRVIKEPLTFKHTIAPTPQKHIVLAIFQELLNSTPEERKTFLNRLKTIDTPLARFFKENDVYFETLADPKQNDALELRYLRKIVDVLDQQSDEDIIKFNSPSALKHYLKDMIKNDITYNALDWAQWRIQNWGTREDFSILKIIGDPENSGEMQFTLENEIKEPDLIFDELQKEFKTFTRIKGLENAG